MAFNPRYIQAQDVIDETIGKIPYNLVSRLPSPDTVSYDLDGNTVLYWNVMPVDFLLLSPLPTGAIVTQVYLDPLNPLVWITAMGNYQGYSVSGGYKVILNNVGQDPFVGGLNYIINFMPDPNTISLQQLQTQIIRAEAQVEMDLNPFYVTPFVFSFENIDYPYNQIPVPYIDMFQNSKDYISNMIVTKAVIYMLRMGFGKVKGGNGGEDYIKDYKEQYYELKKPFYTLAKTGNFLHFPLKYLRLNHDNLSTPYVYAPRVYNDNVSSVIYAKNRINNPSVTVMYPWGVPRRFN